MSDYDNRNSNTTLPNMVTNQSNQNTWMGPFINKLSQKNIVSQVADKILDPITHVVYVKSKPYIYIGFFMYLLLLILLIVIIYLLLKHQKK